MKHLNLAATALILAAAPALAHETVSLPHVHPHGSDIAILAALAAAVVVVVMRLRRR